VVGVRFVVEPGDLGVAGRSVQADRFGKRLHPGDRVRLLRRPLVRRDPPETKTIFRRAFGRTFVIEEFSDYGFAELDLRKIQKWDSVWVEPELLAKKQYRPIARLRILPDIECRWREAWDIEVQRLAICHFQGRQDLETIACAIRHDGLSFPFRMAAKN